MQVLASNLRSSLQAGAEAPHPEQQGVRTGPGSCWWLLAAALGILGHPARRGVLFFVTGSGGIGLSTNEREKRVRVNRQIRISPVRVISDSGEQLGVLPVDEALAVDGYAGEQLDPFGAVTTRVASIRARTSGPDTLPGGASPVRRVSAGRAAGR